jgi:type IV pilus assembly protein PilW
MIKTFKKNKANKQLGFTLIEVMIGLLIGLIATLVITQVFSTFEGKKRTTTGVSDAQTNGSIAMYNIQREVQSAGYGLPILDGEPIIANANANANANAPSKPNNSALLCSGGLEVDHDDDSTTRKVDVFPIVIGTDANGSDTITVGYGSAEYGAIATNVTAPSTGAVISVGSNIACDPGSIVLYTDVVGGVVNCTEGRMPITGKSASARTADKQALIANPKKINLKAAMTVSTTGKVSCIGETFQQVVFAVIDNQLTRTDVTRPSLPIVSDIVNIQAQYGISAPQSNIVTSWVDTVTDANRNQVRAIRVAVVSRASKPENTVVTKPCTSLTAANPKGLCAWEGTISQAPAIDLSATPNWDHYRYRVYETIIPIRNLTFAGTVI